MADVRVRKSWTVDEIKVGIGKWVKELTVETAYDELTEAVRDEGFDNRPTVVVDGKYKRPVEEVKPYGKVAFVGRSDMVDVVRFALTELQKKSPVRTGRYASSHTVLIDGKEVEGDIWAAVANAGETSRVQIVNTQPYARKLEGQAANKKTGRGKRKPSSAKAKGGIYRPVLRALVARYSKSMFFDFKMVKLNLGVKVWGNQGGGRRKSKVLQAALGNYKVKRVQRDQVYPALQFYQKPDTAPN